MTATSITVKPYPFWQEGTEEIRSTGDAHPCSLVIGPAGGSGQHAGVTFTVGPGGRPSTQDPEVLRAFAAAMLRWADVLEVELAKPPVGQGELL